MLGLLSALVFTASGCRSADRISRAEAVTIAQAEARRLGYSFDHVVVDADERNTAWHAFMSALEKADPQAVKEPVVSTILEQLRTRTYWAVRLSERPRAGHDLFDGSVWIFVDDRSGAVLGQLGNRSSKGRTIERPNNLGAVQELQEAFDSGNQPWPGDPTWVAAVAVTEAIGKESSVEPASTLVTKLGGTRDTVGKYREGQGRVQRIQGVPQAASRSAKGRSQYLDSDYGDGDPAQLIDRGRSPLQSVASLVK